MTNPISNASGLAPLDQLTRKSSGRGGATAELAAARATAPEAENTAPNVASSTQGANSVGFKEVQERLKQEPDFDRAKVDAIKQAIQNGQYPLNPRRIAECFVALEQLISD